MRLICRRALLLVAGALLTPWSATSLSAGATGPTQPPPPVPAQVPNKGGSESGLPIPRFVSLKADRVNLRAGPGTDYPTAWVFRRAGLPVEVMGEFEGWRQVRDAEGASGWIVQSLLSGRRTALVSPWDVKAGKPAPQVPVRYSDSEKSRTVFNVEAGVIANVLDCDGRWCRISIDRFKGYMQQKLLWGVYENEVVK